MTGVGEEELYGSLLRAARAEPHALAIFCGPELPEGGYRALAELMTAGSVGLALLSAPIESFIEARRRSGAGGFTVIEAVGPGGIPDDMDVDIPLLVKLRADHPGGELKLLDFSSSAGDWLSAAIDRCAVLALGWAGDEASAVSATATALRASSEVTRGVIWALPTESTAGHQLRELLASDLGQDGRVSLAEVADPVALLSRLAEALAEPREANVRFDPVVGGRVRGAELVGREHELRLASELLLSDFGVVVKGIPGIGKSALAGQLADLLEPDFESVLWWDCSQPGAAEVVVANLQERWGRPLRQGPPDATSISEAIRERRVLCVFDDFESQVEVGSETFASSTWLTIFEALRRAPGCRSLVTTTDWRPPPEAGDLQVLTLEGLEPKAASRLYSRFATERIDEPNVDELVDELGGHPPELIGSALAGERHPSRGDRGSVLRQPRLVKAIERVLRRLSPAEAEAMVRLSVMRSRTPPEAFEWLGIAPPATKLLQARSLVTGMSDGSLEVHASIARESSPAYRARRGWMPMRGLPVISSRLRDSRTGDWWSLATARLAKRGAATSTTRLASGRRAAIPRRGRTSTGSCPRSPAAPPASGGCTSPGPSSLACWEGGSRVPRWPSRLVWQARRCTKPAIGRRAWRYAK